MVKNYTLKNCRAESLEVSKRKYMNILIDILVMLDG